MEKFEVRLNDFDIKENDILCLKEHDGQKYTGREMNVCVDYVAKINGLKFWTKEEIEKYGYQIIQFRKKN
jgi:hypothetical protein